MLVPRLTCRTLWLAVLTLLKDAWKAVGRRRLVTERERRLALVWVTVLLYICSLYLRPPRKKHIPRMRSRLARIEPTSDAWTMRISSLESAMLESSKHQLA